MIVKSNSKCTHPKCKESALYGMTVHVACETRGDLSHLNLVEQPCEGYSFLYILRQSER